MPSYPYLILRSAQRARLEGRTAHIRVSMATSAPKRYFGLGPARKPHGHKAFRYREPSQSGPERHRPRPPRLPRHRRLRSARPWRRRGEAARRLLRRRFRRDVGGGGGEDDQLRRHRHRRRAVAARPRDALAALGPLGAFPYRRSKDLALFVWMPLQLPEPKTLVCASQFSWNGRMWPELDRFGVFTYEEALGRVGKSLADGVFLSDGTLNMAILKFKTDQLGKGMDFRGIHHFGILVEDVDEFTKRLDSLGAEHYIDQGHGGNQAGYFEKKFYGPERVLFDIAEHGWAGAEPLPEPVKEAAE